MKTKTVLVAVDFSAVSPKVLAMAVDLAKAIKGRLLIRHIVQFPPAAMNVYAVGQDPSPLLFEAQEDAESRLAALGKAITTVPVETSVPTGNAADEICREAEAHHADFIVIGSHGHGALYELLVGSTAQGVLRRSSVPVLIVPATAPVSVEDPALAAAAST